jgi:hypothetical protein
LVGARDFGPRLDSIWQFLHVLASHANMIAPVDMDCGPRRILCCYSRTHESTRRVSADGCRRMLLQARGAARHGGAMFKSWAALAGSRPLQSVEVFLALLGLLGSPPPTEWSTPYG